MRLPDAVQMIVRHAVDNGCNVICFDPDGPDLEGSFTVFINDEETPHESIGFESYRLRSACGNGKW